jgi:hypothetical protein
MSSTRFSGQQYVPQTFSPVTFTFFSLHKYYDLPAAVTSKSHILLRPIRFPQEQTWVMQFPPQVDHIIYED